eukprot:scaffold181163_cov36-Cyclotella_meneghiniana.AAC.1
MKVLHYLLLSNGKAHQHQQANANTGKFIRIFSAAPDSPETDRLALAGRSPLVCEMVRERKLRQHYLVLTYT